jgi:catechol 2,3-dioxygenase-like lactoylglutathione lyase family enzyme
VTEIVDGVHSISVHITDAARARAFYRDTLGLEEKSFDGAANRVVFHLPGTTILLTMHIMAPGEEGRPPGTVAGVAFRTRDPAAACAEIARRGGTVTVQPTLVETPGGSFTRAAFADPDGNEFLLTNRAD